MLAIHINERQTKQYTVIEVLRKMHLRGHHAVELLVDNDEMSQPITLVVAERMKSISVVTC